MEFFRIAIWRPATRHAEDGTIAGFCSPIHVDQIMTEPHSDNPFAPPTVQEIPVTVDGDVNYERLQTVGVGLGLVYLSLLLLVLTALIGGAVAYAVVETGGSPAIMLVIGLIAAGIGLLSFIGGCLCAAVPSETGARGFVIASLVLQGIQLAGSVAGFGLGPMEILLLGVPSIILFVMFLRRLSLFIGRPDLARRALIFLTVLAFLIVGGGFAAAWLRGPGFFEGILLAGLPSLLLFVIYANLVNELGRSIRRSGQRITKPHIA